MLMIIPFYSVVINFEGNVLPAFPQESSLPFDKAIEFNVNNDEITKFWNWDSSLGVKDIPDSSNPSKETECVIHIDKNKKLIYLLDPYFLGKITQKCDIPVGYQIIIPLYAALCDTGQIGSENYSFEELLKCAKEADKGDLLVKMDIDNINFINYKASVGNSPPNEYIREIESSKSVESIIPPNSRGINSGMYNKAGTYLGASHGWFAILPPLSEGAHTLFFRVEVIATGEMFIQANEWNFVSEITYDFNVKK
jgi:hypothetical protein